MNHNMFSYQFNVLPQQGFRCVAMDIRGNGQSDKPWGGYTYDRMADDIYVVLEALKIRDAVLLGFSGRHISKLALVNAVSPYGASKEQADDFNKKLVEFIHS